MMQLKIKNMELPNFLTFLTDLKIKGVPQNRARFQVVKIFKAKVDELAESQKVILDEFVMKDVSGKPIVKNDEYQLKPNSRADYNQEHEALLNEEALITIDDYKDKFKTLYDFLLKYDQELDGANGYAFGAFLDEMERVGINA